MAFFNQNDCLLVNDHNNPFHVFFPSRTSLRLFRVHYSVHHWKIDLASRKKINSSRKSTMSSESGPTFKRLSLDETLKQTFVLYCSGWKVLTQLAAMIVALDGGIWAILVAVLVPAMNIEGDKFSDPDYLLTHMGEFYSLLGIRSLVSTVVGAIMTGPMVRAVIDVYMQKTPDLKSCMKVGIKRAPTIFVTSVIGSFAVLLGFLLLFFPGLYLCIRWFFLSPVIVVEGLGALASFKRSSELSSGSWCYVFCTFLICYFFMIVVQLIWSYIFLGGNDVGKTMVSVTGSIIDIIPAVVFQPVLSIVMTLMYLNMRIEKEGLNADVLTRNMGDSGAIDSGYSLLIDQSMEEAQVTVSNDEEVV